MQIDKQQILDLLREQGKHDQAKQAHRDLPDRVDTDQHSDMLEKLGLDPQDLIAKLAGGGLGGLLG